MAKTKDEYVRLGNLGSDQLVPVEIEYEKGKWAELVRFAPTKAGEITLRLMRLIHRARMDAAEEAHARAMGVLRGLDKGLN